MLDGTELKSLIERGDGIFLIGNGINLATGKCKSWKELLKDIINAFYVDDQMLMTILDNDIQGITYPEIASVIENSQNLMQKYERKLKQEIIRATKCDLRGEKACNNLLEYTRRHNSKILTTNYDLNIEDYLWTSGFRKEEKKTTINSSKKKVNYKYSWGITSCEPNCNHSVEICHIHGRATESLKILLSLKDYLNASNYAEDLLKNALLNVSENQKYTGIWLEDFVKKPLIITGLALEPQEIFLRSLLLLREKYIRANNLLVDTSFYLDLESKGNDSKYIGRKLFLDLLGIKTFELDNIYYNSIWD